MGWIYIIKNKLDNKCYVGQTTQSVKARLNNHKCDSRTNSPINRAICKYGLDNFEIISMTCSEEYLDWMEQEWIKEMNSLVPNGYNLQSGGQLFKHHHAETKRILSNKRKGKNNPMYGKSGLLSPTFGKTKILSEETKKKISIATIISKNFEEVMI